MTTAAHHEAAVHGEPEAGQKAAQLRAKTAQQVRAGSPQGIAETPENTGGNGGFPVFSGGIQIAETGLEPVTTGL